MNYGNRIILNCGIISNAKITQQRIIRWANGISRTSGNIECQGSYFIKPQIGRADQGLPFLKFDSLIFGHDNIVIENNQPLSAGSNCRQQFIGG